jgi:hypothetical protein
MDAAPLAAKGIMLGARVFLKLGFILGELPPLLLPRFSRGLLDTRQRGPISLSLTPTDEACSPVPIGAIVGGNGFYFPC